MFVDGSGGVTGGVLVPEPAAVSEDELAVRAVEIERQRTRLDAELVGVLAELDARKTCDRVHGLGTAGWLAREARLPAGVAKTRVGVATKLARHLPVVADALAAGTIGWDHARVLAELANPRIVGVVVANQELLVGLADRCRFEQWRGEVRALGRMWDTDGGFDPNEDPASNRLSYGSTIDGLTSLAVTLTGDNAEVVTQAIEAKADELYRQARSDWKKSGGELAVPSRSTLRALALTALIRQALGVDMDSSKGPQVDVTLVIDADEPDVASNPDGVRLADGSSRVLLCDAAIHALIVDSLGVPLDLGRQVRWARDGQRRAARRRDGGCVFAGCEARVWWCDLHHCVHDEHDGVTDLCNLVCLCRHHHGVMHRTGWSVHLDGDGWAIFTTPSGKRFWGQRHGRQREGPPPDPAARPDTDRTNRTNRTGDAGAARPGSIVAPGRYHRSEDPVVAAEARQLTLARLADLHRAAA